MGTAASSRFYRRRAFWVLIIYCLALIAGVTWSVARAVRLLNGPSVVLPGDGFGAVAITPDGCTLYVLNGNYGDIVPDDSTVTLVSTADGRSSKAIRTGGLFGHTSAFSFAITPDGRTAYVAQGDVVAIGLPRLSRLTDAHAGRKTSRPLALRAHSRLVPKSPRRISARTATAVVDRDLGCVAAGHSCLASVSAASSWHTGDGGPNTRGSRRDCRDHAGLWNRSITRQPLVPR